MFNSKMRDRGHLFSWRSGTSLFARRKAGVPLNSRYVQSIFIFQDWSNKNTGMMLNSKMRDRGHLFSPVEKQVSP